MKHALSQSKYIGAELQAQERKKKMALSLQAREQILGFDISFTLSFQVKTRERVQYIKVARYSFQKISYSLLNTLNFCAVKFK